MNEHTNTVRALADQPLLVTSLWCYLNLHNYEKWGEAKQPNERRVLFLQSRRCAHCNIVQTREVDIPERLK